MIHRRIIRTKTIGSRSTADLRPIITDLIPRGINMLVLEYDEAKGECICEIYGSDNELLKPEEKCSAEKIDEFTKRPEVLEVLASHKSSPPIITTILISEEGIKMRGSSVDETRKEIIIKGKRYKYLRKELDLRSGTHVYVIDEG